MADVIELDNSAQEEFFEVLRDEVKLPESKKKGDYGIVASSILRKRK